MIATMDKTNEITCKGCGLNVQKGYPKCPRCKMPLSRRAARDSLGVQGGTIVPEDEESTSLFIPIAILLAVAVGIAFFVFKGNSNQKDLQTNTKIESSRRNTNPSPTVTTLKSDVQVGFDTDDTKPDSDKSQQETITNLTAALQENRLWSTLKMGEGDSTLLVIISAACNEASMKTVISEAQEKLREAGFLKVQCQEKHGAMVFETSL